MYQNSPKVVGYGQGGIEFLDEAAKFFNKLTEADVVAGHNVLFDITTFMETIRNQSGFDKHEGAQKAIAAFEDKWSKNENFVVDTLEYARTYLNDKMNARMDAMVGDEAVKLRAFRDLLFSEDFMSKIKLGGSTATSSMEAISVNTNLLHLLEEKGKAGDTTAEELMQALYKRNAHRDN